MAFNIPVCIFIFKRSDLAVRVISQLKKIKPKKIYLLADGPRNPNEEVEIKETRKIVECEITWDCTVIKFYNKNNVGVIDNIGGGALKVFKKEKFAIFLEDDNFPSLSFFSYCEELLKRYENNEKLLWICGTNYLENIETLSSDSYFFTKNLLPCGWASWANKFNRYYDHNLTSFIPNPETKKQLKSKYRLKALFRQQYFNFKKTKYLIQNNRQKASWDYQMAYSIHKHDLFGIMPNKNLIQNIGVDGRSSHGGTSMKKTMTNRFCWMSNKELDFPLIHPTKIACNDEIEELISKIILIPLLNRIAIFLFRYLKTLLGIGKYTTFSEIKKNVSNRL